jgi:hypothetical protein
MLSCGADKMCVSSPQHINISSNFHGQLKNNFLSKIITGDVVCCLEYDPGRKRSLQWKQPTSA